MDVRMVVTGKDASGKSVFVDDRIVEPQATQLVPGSEFHRLWGSDETPKVPLDGSPPEHSTFFPPPTGYRFLFFSLPPGEAAPAPDIDLAAALQEFEEKLPGMASHMEPDDPGMHTTQTVDVGVVLAGEAVLELDDGAETVLRTGDTYIQNGTRHRWHNRGDVPFVIAVAIIGAEA
jgi:mannose-6-phosphate isomerase-like protein (cupin superfamily)